MNQVIGGLVLGLALGAGGLYAAQTYVLAPAPDCAGLCGDGTICADGLCIVAEPSVAPELEPEPDEGKSKKKKRRGSKRKAGADAAPEPGSGPPLDDDSRVPRFDPNKDQTIGMSDGSGRLSDSQVNRELDSLDPQLRACVRDANDRVDELGTGTVKYSFGVAGTGKVTGVNVSAPANLKSAGIVPCVRKAVYGHKFPSFDGPEMKVSSSFSVH